MAKTGNKSILNGVLYFINVIAALALMASYLSFYIPPNVVSIFAFTALAYPILFIINMLFILYWALRAKRKLLLSIIAILIGFNHFNRWYQINSTQTVISNRDKLKIMSYNVRMFNAYHWIPEENVPEKIGSMVKGEDPDILLMQEYYQSKTSPRLGYTCSFIKPTNKSGNYGLSIFSKYPIVNTGSLELMDVGEQKPAYNNQFIFADIDWNGQIVRCINIHLASVGLETQDYQRLQNPNEGSQEEIKNGFTKIVKQLHGAFQKRAEQVVSLKHAINSSPYPVIVCGDFNDTPQSYTYHQIDILLEDAFMEKGSGFGKTYARGPLPFRIDYIFHSDQLKSLNFNVLEPKLSDHYPIVSEITWDK